MDSTDLLSIGEAAERSGMATSALRFYEEQGLIQAERTSGNQPRFRRAELRRIAVIRAAQSFGLTLDQIRDALESLPDGRTPTRRDWQRLARRWQSLLDDRIAELQRLRDDADSCIGCGCLSLQSCRLYNTQDRAGSFGQGVRYLQGDNRGKSVV